MTQKQKCRKKQNATAHMKTHMCVLSYLKSGAKKIGHVFCSADQEISLLALKWIRKGQNNLFQALKWGIVSLSTSNSSRDMTKRNNSIICNFHDLV